MSFSAATFTSAGKTPGGLSHTKGKKEAEVMISHSTCTGYAFASPKNLPPAYPIHTGGTLQWAQMTIKHGEYTFWFLNSMSKYSNVLLKHHWVLLSTDSTETVHSIINLTKQYYLNSVQAPPDALSYSAKHELKTELKVSYTGLTEHCVKYSELGELTELWIHCYEYQSSKRNVPSMCAAHGQRGHCSAIWG